MAESEMNRWQATTNIVRAFVDKGHPSYALAALALILLTTGGIAGAAYAFRAPALARLL